MFGLLALAFAQLGRGQVAEATETLPDSSGKSTRWARRSQRPALGDLALYQGRFGDAGEDTRAEGAATDIATKDSDTAANKFAALAYAHLLRQQKAAAIAAADKALANSTLVNIRFMAARVFVEAGAAERAHAGHGALV